MSTEEDKIVEEDIASETTSEVKQAETRFPLLLLIKPAILLLISDRIDRLEPVVSRRRRRDSRKRIFLLGLGRLGDFLLRRRIDQLFVRDAGLRLVRGSGSNGGRQSLNVVSSGAGRRLGRLGPQRPRQTNRTAAQVRNHQRVRGQGVVFQGQGNSGGGVQRSEGGLAGHSVRGHSRSVLRPQGTLQGRRWCSRHKLSLYGGLCRQRLLQRGDLPLVIGPQSPLSGQNHTHSRQSRVQANHSSLRFLRRMPQKIRIHHSVEILHRNIRLSEFERHYRRKNILCPRRTFAQYPDPRPDSHHRPQARSATRRAHVRFAVVRPRRYSRLGRFSPRSRLPIRLGRRCTVQSGQRHWNDLQGTSIGHGGIQVALQWDRINRVVSTQLLLPVRKRCSHFGIGRKFAERIYHFRSSSSRKQGNSVQKAPSRLFPLISPPRTMNYTFENTRIILNWLF